MTLPLWKDRGERSPWSLNSLPKATFPAVEVPFRRRAAPAQRAPPSPWHRGGDAVGASGAGQAALQDPRPAPPRPAQPRCAGSAGPLAKSPGSGAVCWDPEAGPTTPTHSSQGKLMADRQSRIRTQTHLAVTTGILAYTQAPLRMRGVGNRRLPNRDPGISVLSPCRSRGALHFHASPLELPPAPRS